MKIYKITETCEYRDLTFDVELEYYYDDIIDEYYVDIFLGNKNLETIKNEYMKYKKLLEDQKKGN